MNTPQPIDHTTMLELMKMNYQNLHKSTWECHKIYWTMTSIILPLSFVLLGLFFEHAPAMGRFASGVFLTVIAAIITFWFVGSFFLNSWNETRRKQLVKIERDLNQLVYGLEKGIHDENRPYFAQYDSKRLPYRSNFKYVTRILYGILMAAVIGIAIQVFRGQPPPPLEFNSDDTETTGRLHLEW